MMMPVLWWVALGFFPRLTLICTYMFGTMPNTEATTWGWEIVGTIFMPRTLAAYWAYESYDASVLLLIVCVVLDLTLKARARTASKKREST